jgi:fimbrial chaperone protein
MAASLARLAGAALGLLAGVGALAADLTVMPVGLALAPGHERAAVTVGNQGKEATVVEVETLAWSQADGQDSYAPTRDLVVNPPLFTLKPGRAQVVRVGLRQPATGERESAYRLVLREVPREAAPAAGQVRVLLQMRLPVYVAPARVAAGQHWRSSWTGDGDLAVTLTNTGNVHQVVGELKLRAADAAPDSPALAALTTSSPVFPGQSRTWRLRPPAGAPEPRYTLEVTTDRGPHHVALDPGRP